MNTPVTDKDMNTLDNAAFRTEIRTWIEANYPPELRNPPLRLHLKENWPWYKLLSDKGWLAPGWPREYGGMGLSPEKHVILTEEFERHGAARLNDHGISLLGPLLIKYATEAQKAHFLPRILAGQDIWCQGYSEPGSGSDLASLRTSAELDGDEWVINGQKTWTTLANDANWIFLLVRTDKTVKKQRGISFILVPMDAPGVTVRPILNLEMHDEFCEVFLDNVRVPAENLVGEINQGWTMAKALLGFERLFLGSPRQAGYALSRLVMLAEKLGVADDPVLSDQIAQYALDLADHKLLFASFLREIAQGNPVGSEISLLKISQSELFQRISSTMMDIAGEAAGLVDPIFAQGALNPAGQFLQARPTTIYGGTAEIQRNIIAKQVLELPG